MNLKMRMSMRPFTRLTNGFSKKLQNHEYMVALYASGTTSCASTRRCGPRPRWRPGSIDPPTGIDKGWIPACAGISVLRLQLPAPLRSDVLVDRVDPAHFFGFFHRFDVEVDDDRLVVAAYQHAFQGLVGRRVDLL